MDVKTAQNDHLQNALRLLWGHRIAVPHSRQFCFRRLCGHSTLRCWRRPVAVGFGPLRLALAALGLRC